jgi:pilus assembly protein CpaF
MSLKSRLEKNAVAMPMGPALSTSFDARARSTVVATADPFVSMRQRAQESLFARIGTRLYDASLAPDQLRAVIMQELQLIFDEIDATLSDDNRRRLMSEVAEDVLGYGPIQEFLVDDEVTEIMVNATDPIYVERAGQIVQTTKRFLTTDHLRRVVDRIVSEVGRRVDESSPMVDARLPDGSRVNAIIPPLAIDGPALTIRKFSKRSMSVEDLCGLQTLSPRLAQFIEVCVRSRCSILVSGGTGSGKTTLLNVASSFISGSERVVTIEDAAELRLQQRHIVRLEARPANIEGKGEVTIRDLVRNALRMRPDRVVVGEVRGAEALDMLQAMNTGHEGSLTTLHANTPRDALARLETMVLMAGLDLPLAAIRDQIASAIDLIIHVARLSDGTRRVVSVTDVDGMEGNVIQMNDIFAFDYDAGLDEHGRYRGTVKPTGIRPSFERKIRNHGYDLGTDLFTDDAARGLRAVGGQR